MAVRRHGRKRFSRRRRRKKGRSSFGKKLLRNAKTSRIDSAAEKAVAIIAEREAKKLMPSPLIFRRYLFADFDKETNIMNNGTRVTWEGEIVSLGQIPIMDNATVATYAQQVDPDIRPNPNYAFGINVIAPQRYFNGYRRGNRVKINNFQLGLRMWTDQIGVGVVQALDKVFVKYAVIAVQQDVANQELALSVPAPEHMLDMKVFGFSSRLDYDLTEPKRPYKIRTLLQGGQVLNYSTVSKQTRQKEHFVKLKKPIVLEYEPGNPLTGAPMDQYGQKVIGPWKLFLVVRSSCPGTYAPLYQPSIGGYIKLSYSDQ